MKQIAWEKTMAYEAGHTFGQNFDIQTLPALFVLTVKGWNLEGVPANCRRVYPSVVEEMEGIAQGRGGVRHRISFWHLRLPLFRAAAPAAADEEEIFFSRNSDFLPAAGSRV